MSASLFRSKQFQSKKKLKKYLISAPVPADTSNIVLGKSAEEESGHAVVLITKYPFEAQEEGELSVKAKEYLKLLERPGNGWVLVKKVSAYDTKGLVPASYLDIAVNDSINPVTLEWLNEFKPVNIEKETEQPFPKIIEVRNVCQDSNCGIWYRMEVTLSTNEVIQIGKYYEDIYKVHIDLATSGFEALPKIPHPPRSQSVDDSIKSSKVDRKHLQEILQRSAQITEYFKTLIKIDEILKSTIMFNFINDKRKINVNTLKLSDREIIDKIISGSKDIKELIQSSTFFSLTEPLPPVENNTVVPIGKTKHGKFNNLKYSAYMHQVRNKKLSESTSSNSLMSYTSLIEGYDDSEQMAPIEEDTKKSALSISTTDIIEQSSHLDSSAAFSSDSTQDSVFSREPMKKSNSQEMALSPISITHFDFDSVQSLPASPRRQSPNVQDSDVKIKIYLNNLEDDVVIYRIKKSNLTSVDYLKKLLSHKIFRDSSKLNYKLEARKKGQEMNDAQLINYIKSLNKVHLNLIQK